MDQHWNLIQHNALLATAVVATVGVGYAARRRFKNRKARSKYSVPAIDVQEKLSSGTPEVNVAEAFGPITSLKDFDYQASEPPSIYKFSPKYFLTMGIQKTTIDNIINIDHRYVSRLAARRAIAAARPEVIACLPVAEPAVFEFYTYIVQHWLPQRYPTIFTLCSEQQVLQNSVTGESLPLAHPVTGREALELLNRNLDDDFLFMMPTGNEEGHGFLLQALIWAFPDHTDPAKRLGATLNDLHARVPGYREKLEGSLDRFFRKMEVGRIICRSNWGISIKASQDESQLSKDYLSADKTNDLSPSKIFVRCELQTLFRLPKSGARVFVIHEYVYPLQRLKDEGKGPELIEAIDGLKEGNVPAMWNYKKADDWHFQVKEFLRQ